MAMRDTILEAIKAGGATKESLLELTGTTDKGLASQFTYLRMMGNCLMKQEDGTFKIVSAEEWETHRSSASQAAANLTPEERVKKAQAREKRASSAYDNAVKRAAVTVDTDDGELNKWKEQKAEAEMNIASIELGKAEAALREASETDSEINVENNKAGETDSEIDVEADEADEADAAVDEESDVEVEDELA